MNFIDKMEEEKRIGLAGPRSGPPDVEPSNGPGGAKDYGASRRSHSVLGVPDPETRHISYGVVHIILPMLRKYSRGLIPTLIYLLIPTSITSRSQVSPPVRRVKRP